PGIPDALNALVLRCLAKYPDDRPTSYDELKALLVQCLPRTLTAAPMSRRFVSAAFDGVIVAAALVLIVLFDRALTGNTPHGLPSYVLLIAAIGWLYLGLSTALSGATYGKRATGLQVVTTEGHSTGVVRSLARGAIQFAPALVCLLPAVGPTFIPAEP